MACPGSVTLVNQLAVLEIEDPDYRKDGIQAHALGAHCLLTGVDPWEVMGIAGEFSAITADMGIAVQSYLNYVRAIPGAWFIERRLYRSDVHKQFYGTVDFASMGPGQITIVDYKHGIGIAVDAVGNPQLIYYAFCFISPDVEDGMPVKLVIVQPRGFHPDGPIREWDTTAGEIRQWVKDNLIPAMDATEHDQYLDAGEHCRFCPAKLVCPAATGLYKAFSGLAPDWLKTVADDELGRRYVQSRVVRMVLKALDAEVLRRRLNAIDVPGSKLVNMKTDRAWKTDAPIEAKFGANAWRPQEMRSPAQVEALPGGKEFVAEWAYKPAANLTIAPLDDKRAEVKVQSVTEIFGDALQAQLDKPAEEA